MDKNKENVPKIRFPGFTYPWEQRKLEEEFYKVNERNDGSFGKGHWISVAKMYFQDPEKVTSNNIDTRTYIMRFGDIAFEGNKSKEFKYGRFVANDIGDGVVSELFPIYRHKQEYDNDFWKRAIQLERMMAPIFAKSITSSGTSSNKLDEKHFLRQFVSVPELSEQKQIGSFFNKLDNLITLHQRKLEHLQDKKKGLLQKMFPKGGEKFPELRFPGFTDPWEQRKLKQLANFAKGQGYSKNDLTDVGTPIILYGRLYTNYQSIISEVDTFVVPQSGSVYSTGGEVIVPASGETAEDIARASAIVKSGFLLGGDLNIIYPNKDISTVFLALSISNGKQQKELSKKAQGKSIVHLHNSDLEDVTISFPCLEEQERIGSVFAHIDNLITFHNRKLEHLQQQKKGLLQQMFI